jgi:hypothetical protein
MRNIKIIYIKAMARASKSTSQRAPRTVARVTSASDNTHIQIQPKATKKAKRSRKGNDDLDLPTLGKDGSDPAAEKILKMEGIKQYASLGFCKMDVINAPSIIAWREYNDRGLNKAAAEALKDNFVENGQQSTLPSNVFRLLVQQEWIDTELIPNIAGKTLKDLQEFKLNGVGTTF